MGRRREERLQVNLPVRVWGMDRNGKPFIQSARTVDVTRLGGRLRDLFCLEKKGEIIRIQHGGQKANFKITWVGNPGTAEAGQVGIYCIEPDKYIWGVSLPKKAGPDTYKVADESEFVSFNDPPAAGAAGTQERWTGVNPSIVLTQGENRPGKKRVHPRYACNGSVEVAPEGSVMPVWCMLSDISISGCYAETTSPLPAHTRVHFVLKVGGMEIFGRGVVRTAHPGVGMGVGFTNLSTEDTERLELFLEKLRQEAEAATAPVAPAKPVPTPAPVVETPPPTPIRPPLHDRSLLVAHNRPKADSAEEAPVTLNANIMDRLTQLRSDLWEMQHSLPPNTVDSRLLREVKEAVDHARHSFWAVQQWLELQSQKRDPFKVLQKLYTDRIRTARELGRQLAMDIDAAEIDVDLEGLDDLYLAIRDLHTRLAKLLHKSVK